jgi:MYXO-CTERM domain-containing protein
LLTATPAKAVLIIGAPPDTNNGNEFPFGFSTLVYQQDYAASNFSGPIQINGLTFYNTQTVAGSIQTANYKIELSTSSMGVNAMSNTFAANEGADDTVVFNGPLTGATAPSFTIPLSSVFNYNPALGNLVMTITKTNITGPQGSVFNDARNGSAGAIFSRKYSNSSTTTADNAGFDNGWGLVTGFDSPAAAPEPSTFAPAAIFGLAGLVGAYLRRRRATA